MKMLTAKEIELAISAVTKLQQTIKPDVSRYASQWATLCHITYGETVSANAVTSIIMSALAQLFVDGKIILKEVDNGTNKEA